MSILPNAFKKGEDVFYFRPGEHAEYDCPVCGARCAAQLDVAAHGSFTSAMGGLKSQWDIFTCPNSRTYAHRRATKLKRELDVIRRELSQG